MERKRETSERMESPAAKRANVEVVDDDGDHDGGHEAQDGAVSSANDAMEVDEKPQPSGRHRRYDPSMTRDFLGMVELGPNAQWPRIDLNFPTWAKWVDLFSHYERLVEELKSAADKPKLFHSVDHQTVFHMNMTEFEKNKDSEDVREIISSVAANHIRNAECPGFLPAPDCLSLLIHKIIVTNTAAALGVPAKVFRTLFYYLRKFPPYTKDSREYWLQVISSPTKKTLPTRNKASSSSSTAFTSGSKVSGVAALRLFVKNAVTANPPKMEMITFVQELLETDLYMMQKTQGEEELPGPKRITLEHKDEDGESVAKKKKTSEADIGHLPFAYLMIYEPNEKRKMGIDDKAMKFFHELCRLLTSYLYESEPRSVCARLLALFLEALRWTFVQRGVPTSQYEEDVKRVFRHCRTLGWSSELLSKQFPVEWLKKIIADLK